MKHLLIIIIFSVSWQLFAQSDPDLDLGNVIIQGESSNLTDSVSYQRDFAFYNTVNSETELGFKPQFQPASILNQIPETGSKLAFQALGGISSTRINAVYSQNEIFNFSAEYDFHNIDEDWDQQNIVISWQPKFMGYEFDLTYNDLDQKDILYETKITSYNFGISFPAYKIEKVIPFDSNIDLSFKYLNTKQNSESEKDFNLSANIAEQSTDYNSHVNAEYLNHAFSGFSSFGLNDIKLGKPQLWLGYDDFHLYPSVSFDRSFKISKGVEIQLANLPQISNLNRRETYINRCYQITGQANTEQTFKNKKNLQKKKQLNAYVALHNVNSLPFTIYYNPQFVRDKEMYLLGRGEPIQVYNDLFIQAFVANVYWKLHEFEFENSIEYITCDKNFYFEPKLKLLNSIYKQYGALASNLELNFLADRINISGDRIDDFLQVNLNLEYKYNDSFSVFGYAENLLDTEYSEYYVIPKEGINLYIGCRYGF